jgi:hypothetical protein
MSIKNFKKVDQIDCNVIAFEVKKKVFYTMQNMQTFESSWLKIFVLHKFKAFEIVLGN